MATRLKVGGDVEQALEHVGVPSYVLDEAGVVRWINPAAERLLGDVRGRHFTSLVAPEERPGARERLVQKMLGTAVASEATRRPRLERWEPGVRGSERGGTQER